MKPIKFKEQNCTYAENQPGYLPLPSYKDENGIVTSCWRLSFKERLRVLFSGNLWLCLWSFGKPLTPSFMTTKKRELFPYSERFIDRIVRKNVKLFNKLKSNT